MPDETVDRKRREVLEKLLQANLGTGSIKLELGTADGITYSVSRAFGEMPFVTNADGKPVDIRIGNDMHFGVDIYSQNQIEDIANSDYFQLQLIDKFIQEPLDELERQIRDATSLLGANGRQILDCKKVIGDQTEATRELPDITEKIRGFENADGGAQSEEMRKGHEGKSLRERELKLVESLRDSYQHSSGALSAAALDVKRRFSDAIGQDFSSSSNRDVIAKVKEDAQLALEKMQSHVDAAVGVLRGAEAALKPSQSLLGELHALQEQGYRALLDKDEKERAKGLERTRLEQRHSDLKAKEKILVDAKANLETIYKGRDSLRAQLSDLRDQRYRLRVGVADRLNERLKPMIRIQVNQFGNRDEYRNVLNQAMKGSGMRYASIVERAAERLSAESHARSARTIAMIRAPPAELAAGRPSARYTGSEPPSQGRPCSRSAAWAVSSRFPGVSTAMSSSGVPASTSCATQSAAASNSLSRPACSSSARVAGSSGPALHLRPADARDSGGSKR
jgi:hypothetical protein